MNSEITRCWNDWGDYLEKEFGIRVSEGQRAAFAAYLRELTEWNAKFNLVSFDSPEEVVWRHFADSAAIIPALKKLSYTPASGAYIAADIGTGAGFPGIPVKILMPEMDLLLVESITKKCAFLEHITGLLSLRGTGIRNTRAELLGADAGFREKYDIVLSRALSKFSPNLEAVLPLVKPGGYALIHKYENYEDELKACGAALDILGGTFHSAFSYRLPRSERGGFIVIIAKKAATPEKYPRRPGMAEKKPL